MRSPGIWSMAIVLASTWHAHGQEPAPPLQDFPEFQYFEITASTTPPQVVIPDAAAPERPTKEVVTLLTDAPELLGDQAPVGILLPIQAGSFPRPGADRILVPSPRYFKITDNESPEPRRNYISFNYFYDWGDAVNERLGTDIQRTRIHREIFGWEFADSERRGSIGFRVRYKPTMRFTASTA